MKKIYFYALSTALLVGSFGTVNAASSVDKTASVTIQGGTLDVAVDNDIDFGAVTLTGATQTKANEGAPVTVAVTDALGDSSGWDVQMNISPLVDGGAVPLAGQQYDFTAAGSTVTGTGVTAAANATGVTPGTGIDVISGDASALSGDIALAPGFLTLTVGSSAKVGTYNGTATFSIITNP